MAVEGDSAKKFLAFRIAGVVRAGIRLLQRKVDFPANATRDLLRVLCKEVYEGLLLQSCRQSLAGDFAIPVLADVVSFLDQIEPVLLLRRNSRRRVDRNHGTTNASRQAISFRRNAQVNPIALANLPVESRTNQGTVGRVASHHDLKAVALRTQHATDPGAPGRNLSFETSRAENRQHSAQHRI